MPTLVNNLRAIRGPVTSVPMVGVSGVIVEADTQNNQVVVRADETVLYTGTSYNTNLSLSESPANFKFLRIKFDEMGTGRRVGYIYCNDPSLASIGAAGMNFFTDDSTDSVHIDSMRFAVNGSSLTMDYAQKKWLSLNNTSGTQTTQSFGAASILSVVKIYEIVGIDRIAG